ncbi:MAG: penicillin-insensitive murein endopeptidase [Gammaproteobacteria bacterium]
MKFSMVLLLAMVFSDCAANSDPHAWARVAEPKASPHAKSIGTYTAGCLSGAVALPANGPGYQVMRLSRKRFYGHPTLIQFIEHLGSSVAGQQLGELLIGDLGQPRGGPTLTGHRSHQNGLDVDIWFLLSEQAANRVLAYNERESWGAPSVLLDHSDRIDSRQWSRAHEQILEIAARMPEVERIFVNPSIKRQLCKNSVRRDWLRKIRPWWKHDDHFHVRLKCPEDSKDCLRQEPLPPVDGCDASLAWWFSAEAKAPAKKAPPPKVPVLPAQCDSVLTD